MHSPTASYINVPVYVPFKIVTLINQINVASQTKLLPRKKIPILPRLVQRELSDATSSNNTPVRKKLCVRTQPRKSKIEKKKRSYKCDVCGDVFSYKKTLKQHTNVNHGEERPHKCTECGDTFTQKTILKTHVRQHKAATGTRHNPLYNCDVCGVVFADVVTYRKHASTHVQQPITLRNIEQLKCSVCAVTLTTKRQYRNHMRKHRVNFPPILPNIFSKLYTCTACGAVFADTISFDQHKNLHTSLGIANLNAVVQQPMLDGNNAVSGPHQSVPIKIELAQSEPIQSVQILKEPYKCNSCGDDFADQGSLQSHIRKVHYLDRPHKCKECGVFFKFKSQLVRHFYVHSAEKLYNCDECGAAFKTKSVLKTHTHIHSDEFPHKCLECGAVFRQKCDLRSHAKVHSSEAPHKCTECGYAFKSKSNLRRHLRMHRHSGEKRYKCNECNSAFTRKRVLRAHSESCSCKI